LREPPFVSLTGTSLSGARVKVVTSKVCDCQRKHFKDFAAVCASRSVHVSPSIISLSSLHPRSINCACLSRDAAYLIFIIFLKGISNQIHQSASAECDNGLRWLAGLLRLVPGGLLACTAGRHRPCGRKQVGLLTSCFSQSPGPDLGQYQ
jgi:hypothetical protein